MNPQRIAEEFRSVFDPVADLRFHELPAVNGFNSAAVVLPRIVVRASFRPHAGSANIGVAEVSVIVESHAGGDAADEAAAPVNAGEAAAAHEARGQLVREKLFGLAEDSGSLAKASVIAAINARGNLEVQPRYVPTGDTGLERDGDRFRTTLRLKAGVLVKSASL